MSYTLKIELNLKKIRQIRLKLITQMTTWVFVEIRVNGYKYCQKYKYKLF